MIPVPRPTPENEPELFDKNCRIPGNDWLNEYPAADPRQQSQWWRPFKPDLARLFSHRCGWLGTYIGLEGTVDHCLPIVSHRHLSFEWANYRYCTGTINSRKSGSTRVLDPCDVQPGWFRVDLHSFQLLLTQQVPDEFRDLAEATLNHLQLRRGHQARWSRWDWYKKHWNGGQPRLEDLRRDAPLVADAVELALENKEPLPNPDELEPEHRVQARQRRWARRPSRG